MTRKIEPKAVAIGAVISVIGSVFLTVFVIFWAGFVAASASVPGLQLDRALWARAVGLTILVVDLLVGLAAGVVAGKLASAHPVA